MQPPELSKRNIRQTPEPELAAELVLHIVILNDLKDPELDLTLASKKSNQHLSKAYIYVLHIAHLEPL